jgi:DNA-binding transcriptional ArsR family regulator
MSKNMLKSLTNGQLESVARYFVALGEVSRLRILQAINSGERSVTEVAEITKLNQPNVSRHLSILLAAGLIQKRKEGVRAIYFVSDSSLVDIFSVVGKRLGNRRNHSTH